MHRWSTLLLSSAALVLLLADAAVAQQVRRAESLRGGNENPPIVTDATGNFRATIFPDSIEFRLRYDAASVEDEEPSDVTQAHLHLANPGINGAIVAFLCVNPPLEAPAPATADPCPPSPSVIEGVIEADDVLANEASGLEAGDIAALGKLIRQGAVYANVHSIVHPSGEIRGQVSPRIR